MSIENEDKAAWLAENLLGWAPEFAGAYFENGNHMLEIIEAMRERGPYEWEIYQMTNRKTWLAQIERYAPDHKFFKGEHESMPTAVIEAAYAALKEDS